MENDDRTRRVCTRPMPPPAPLSAITKPRPARRIAKRPHAKPAIPGSVFARITKELVGGHLRIAQDATDMLHAEAEAFVAARFASAAVVAAAARRETVGVDDMRAAAQVRALYPCDNTARPC